MLPESDPNINHAAMQTDLVAHLDGLEQRMGLLQRQVEQLQRLATLGTISTMLAHEFNNILTPIVSYCGYALQRGDTDLLRTAVEKTHQNAQRMTRLCGKYLGMAVDDQMGPVDTLLHPLVSDAVECLGRDLDKDNIALTIDVPQDLKARATAGSLQQVLFNLVINARQAMLGRAGQLRIGAMRTDEGKVVIEIADNGPGIKPEHIECIFEPFFSTKGHENKRDRHGIGLGLHICRQLMEEQGGSIEVRSEFGKGATFILTLPASQGE